MLELSSRVSPKWKVHCYVFRIAEIIKRSVKDTLIVKNYFHSMNEYAFSKKHFYHFSLSIPTHFKTFFENYKKDFLHKNFSPDQTC